MSISSLISIIMSMLMALVAMAFYTLMERKFLGYFQLRKGPNKVSIMGIPQPFADAIKLFIKERTEPSMSNTKIFYLAPVMGLVLTLMLWNMYPYSTPSFYINFGILYFLCVSSMNVYVVFLAGWCSNSKYSLLGSLRAVAQTISYEVSMALVLINALIVLNSMNMHTMTSNMMSWITLMMFPILVTWFITNLAETNRTPFDLAEGESELVSGFNTEYSSGLFAMVFMAEYANILVMSLFTVIIFSGYSPVLMNLSMVLKTTIVALIFIWARATLPRMRYDNLMYLTWKSFLPLSLSSLLIIIILTM